MHRVSLKTSNQTNTTMKVPQVNLRKYQQENIRKSLNMPNGKVKRSCSHPPKCKYPTDHGMYCSACGNPIEKPQLQNEAAIYES